MVKVGNLIFGRSPREEEQEYRELRYRFALILVFFGLISSGLFLIGNYIGANPLPEMDLMAIQFHLVAAFTTFFLLRIRKTWLYPVAIGYELVCLYVFVAALIWVPTDELRILWFYLNIPTVYLILGRLAGVIVTILSLIIVAFANEHSIAPYSSNAIATGFSATLYLSGFFYVFSGKSYSFFLRMLQSNEKLKHMATHDSLTGILNARTFYHMVDHLIAIAHRENQSHSVLFIDLDHFKCINDTHGHDAGDAVLCSVASVIQKTCRESDLLGRVGGEEFSVFLPNTNYEGALHLADTIRIAIESTQARVGDLYLKVTASIGIATNQNRHLSFAEFQREADLAMYKAKQKGRNCVCSLSSLL